MQQADRNVVVAIAFLVFLVALFVVLRKAEGVERVVIREFSFADLQRECAPQPYPLGVHGCSWGGVMRNGPRGTCLIKIRNDTDPGFRQWLIGHELDHCRYGRHYGH